MAFGKTVFAEALDLLEDGFGERPVVAVVDHAVDQLVLKLFHVPGVLPRGHGAAQTIGFVGGEPGRDHRDLHHLLLEDRNAQRAPKCLLECGIAVLDLLAPAQLFAILQVWMHHAALNGAGPNDRHFHHQVVILPRLQARQHRHLCTALDLEHTDGVGRADHVVDLGVVVGDLMHLQRRAAPLVHEVEPAANGAQHAERQHVDLEHAHRLEIVLFPLDDGAVFHRRLLDRHQPCQLGVRQHEAADVLAQMPRKALELVREFEPLRQLARRFAHARSFHRLFEMLIEDGGVEPVMVLGEFVDQPRIDAHRLADIAQRAAGAIADHHGGDGGPLAAVLFVDVLDDFFTPLVLEIDVDVGRLVAFAAQEPLEQKMTDHRVDGGDAQAIADGRIGGRAATLAQDFSLVGKAHDVFDGEEEHLVVLLHDEREFMFDLRSNFLGHAFRIAARSAFPGLAHQRLRRRLAIAEQLQRVLVVLLDFVGIEAATVHHDQRVGQQLGRVEVGQPDARTQMPLGIGLQREAAFGHALAFLDGRDDVVQRLARSLVHVHVAGRDQRHAGVLADIFKREQPEVVVEFVEELDHDPQVVAEHRLGLCDVGAQRDGVDRAAGPAMRNEQNFAVLKRGDIALRT